jgi:thymidylate kinase
MSMANSFGSRTEPAKFRAGMSLPIRTVALIGSDGAGKSTVARAVVAGLPVPSRYLYMGVNLQTSTTVLPTTRLLLALKQRQGGQPDMTAGFDRRSAKDGSASVLESVRRGVRTGVRLVVWTAEEWYRQLVALDYRRRGYLVVMDRHFLYDYYATDVAGPPGRPIASRLHGWMLDRLYPRPDLAVVLDAPLELLEDRRPADDPTDLARHRQEYLDLAGALAGVVVVDGSAPVDEVAALIVDHITNGRPGLPQELTR